MGRPAKYPDAFRRDAISLVVKSGRPIADVARSLGINEGTLWNWVRAARQAEQQATAPGSVTETEREELKRLRKEVIELQTHKEILKRAAAYFARKTIR
jgi:transposase